MAQLREIKRRIKSIASTKKVTKAMEMVSAAKMRKAVVNVLASRSYASLSWDLVQSLASRTESRYHPLLHRRPEIKNVGLVLITSNRGLCGGFNSQIIQKTLNYIKQKPGAVKLVTLGKKGRDSMVKRGLNLAADFTKFDITTTITQIRPLARLLIEDFIAGKFDSVVIAYTDFISTLLQKPRILEILPISSQTPDQDLGQAGLPLGQNNATGKSGELEYLFEPSPDEVLSELLPRLIEMQIYQTILESDAAEHSARMVAMQNASDAAVDMIADLTLSFNKARQSAITAELADISGGLLAME